MKANIGKRLKEIRQEKGLSQKELSEKSGVAQSHISNIERDNKNPTVGVLMKLSEALDEDLTKIISERSGDR